MTSTNRPKRILLACGSGVATSAALESRLEDFLAQAGYEGAYTLDIVKIAEAPGLSADYDFLVATTMMPQHLKCPYVDGTPFLLGEAMEPAQAQVRRLMEA